MAKPTPCACAATGDCVAKKNKNMKDWRNECDMCKKGMHPQCGVFKGKKRSPTLCQACHKNKRGNAGTIWGKMGVVSLGKRTSKTPAAGSETPAAGGSSKRAFTNVAASNSAPSSPARSKAKVTVAMDESSSESGAEGGGAQKVAGGTEMRAPAPGFPDMLDGRTMLPRTPPLADSPRGATRAGVGSATEGGAASVEPISMFEATPDHAEPKKGANVFAPKHAEAGNLVCKEVHDDVAKGKVYPEWLEIKDGEGLYCKTCKVRAAHPSPLAVARAWCGVVWCGVCVCARARACVCVCVCVRVRVRVCVW